ncbi:MAG: glycosyltransferase family 4 protein [Bacteroidetes bacterium]|nr:glycosyltransferase family 4 protein [Bacteroidota bacterium]
MDNCTIISLVPYRILPATSGGHLGIADLHHHLGLQCTDHMIGTESNGDASKYSFTLHKVFTAGKQRYMPRYKLAEVVALAKQYNARYIYCDHPYMAFTAIAASRKLGIPWFMRSHNIESERFHTMGKPWWRLMFAFERYAMQQADGVFFVAPEDKQWAEQHYKLEPARCHIIPYGTNLAQRPASMPGAKAEVAADTNINPNVPWIYFLGALDYAPNTQAIEHILTDIAPRLEKSGKQYEILIAGKNLSEALQQRIKDTPHAHYMGFIPVLDTFLKACDIMLNPVMTGGGIKTKAVEALGYNKMVVSSRIGAAGLIPEACNPNLLVTTDYDWDAFTQQIIAAMDMQPAITDRFYDTYNWDKIATKILSVMKATVPRSR